MTDDNLRGLPLPIPIYFPAIPLIVTVCVTLCKDDILLTTYHIDDMMTYCWQSTCISCSRSSSQWPQWRQDQTQAPQACTHWIPSLVNLGIFLFLISHLSFSLFLIIDSLFLISYFSLHSISSERSSFPQFRTWLHTSFLGQKFYQFLCQIIGIHFPYDPNSIRWIKIKIATFRWKPPSFTLRCNRMSSCT